jgi:tetratricopeptide (TPR) repeat protein
MLHRTISDRRRDNPAFLSDILPPSVDTTVCGNAGGWCAGPETLHSGMGPRADFERIFRIAVGCLNAGDLPGAAEACSALRIMSPTDPAVLQLHATVALRAGRPAEALETVQRSLAVRPGHGPSLLLLARAALEAGTPTQAVAALRQVGDHADASFLLCHALLALRDPNLDQAVQAALRRYPDDAVACQALGLALQRAGFSRIALVAFSAAAAADPALANAHFGRGLLLRDAGRMAEARDALKRAVAVDPTAAGAWFALGLTCQDLLDEAAAAVAFAAALRSRPEFPEAAVNLGIARQRLGDMDGAMEAYRTAVRIRPDTFGRIAQAVTSSRTGVLWLDLGGLHRALGA